MKKTLFGAAAAVMVLCGASPAYAIDPNITALCSSARFDFTYFSNCEVGSFRIYSTQGGGYDGDGVSFTANPDQYLVQLSGIQQLTGRDGYQSNATGVQILGVFNSPIDVDFHNDDPFANWVGVIYDPNEGKSILGSLYGSIRNFLLGSNVKYEQIYFPKPAVAGVRGSYTAPGVVLYEGSPAYYGGVVDGSEISPGQMLDQSFVITSAGDGDWFDISFNGQKLFSSFGADLEPGRLYTASFDASPLAGQQGYLLFQLHSVGDRNFSVGLLDGPETAVPGGVPEPSTWAMMLAGLGIAGYALRRRRVSLAAPLR